MKCMEVENRTVPNNVAAGCTDAKARFHFIFNIVVAINASSRYSNVTLIREWIVRDLSSAMMNILSTCCLSYVRSIDLREHVDMRTVTALHAHSNDTSFVGNVFERLVPTREFFLKDCLLCQIMLIPL